MILVCRPHIHIIGQIERVTGISRGIISRAYIKGLYNENVQNVARPQ